ncbi:MULTISPECIES: UDP-N-acetylmuramoyl-tripeptide--D-alanyl-D-alanine ligase [Candidatus Ichthyocystis]|uniref:UDP-N-acetylmuramoyl-tripeptide--D-alanyl-D- alanine ligase n=1 Tax=Candidatus Ichthyocystis TaxID=2929841 RepID=UPI001F5F99D1|nr:MULTISPECIES: UDP-N-acetylmuramoyl-tripeptide--D-alanyl-D-alanine ligase [Ichthyocystis]
MSLSRLASVLRGKCYGEDLFFCGVETDTRKCEYLSSEALFVALKGNNFDGHDFLIGAHKQGIRSFLVSSLDSLPSGSSAVVVPDTNRALLHMAAYWRQHFSIPLVCVAGSNGKTTVRSMISAIFTEFFGEDNYLATCGNFNNHIGIPKTLFNLNPRHRAAVIEFGMNHPGEMPTLLLAASPTVSVVTNTLHEHMEFMKSLDSIARENGLAYEMLPENGTCIINHDDDFYPLYVRQAGPRNQVWFGRKHNSHVSSTLISRNSRCQTVDFFYHNRCYRVYLHLAGEHNISNAMAAFSVGVALGVSGEVIARALSKVYPVAGRLNFFSGIYGSELIDDTYNSNPDSTRAAIDVLMSSPRRRKLLVMGDMAEMGPFLQTFYRDIACYARSKGVSKLFLLGRSVHSMSDYFGDGATCCNTVEALVSVIKDSILDDAVILVKGSRFMGMERVMAELIC